jgi:DNA-directed RNA polymerase subunit K/omega
VTPPTLEPRTADRLPLSRFLIVALTFQRVRQLKAGARPRVEAPGRTPARLAFLEVTADTISWTIEPGQQPPRATEPGSPKAAR